MMLQICENNPGKIQASNEQNEYLNDENENST